MTTEDQCLEAVGWCIVIALVGMILWAYGIELGPSG